jgi:hypothetical protein
MLDFHQWPYILSVCYAILLGHDRCGWRSQIYILATTYDTCWILKSGRLIEYPRVIQMWGLKGQLFLTAPYVTVGGGVIGQVVTTQREVGLALVVSAVIS